MDEISFEDLGLDERTLAAVERKGFKVPSPIQILAIPRLLNGDANIIAKARTGTGKTAAFGLPIVQSIKEKGDHVRALVLEPTRELAMQTCEEMKSFSPDETIRTTVLYGGARYSTQIKDLKEGCEIVVGTPGRVQDHIERGTLKLDKIDYFILDEGDEMLDMGFIEDIENIFSQANPNSRILLFSATMPPEILKIASKFMGEYEVCEEEGFIEEPLLIDQKYWFVRESDKIEALVRLIDISPDFYGLVFTQTKNDADTVSKMLDERGYEVAALHGDIPQAQREKILARFRIKKTRILVATDVAARGIDITGLSHVVNYSLPFDSSTYVHRIGRTGRAGTSGIAVTFVRPGEERKLKFLSNQLKKAAKGEMVEEAVPEIKDVLAVKRQRMVEELKVKITPKVEFPFEASTGSATGNDLDTELVEVPDLLFTQIAEELTEGKDPKEVLASVLAATFGKTLDESHYGKIKTVAVRGEKGKDKSHGAPPSPDQIRLYVQMGWHDGYNPKKIASFFGKVLRIRDREVDAIEMADKFCLLNLPKNAAKKALEISQRDRKFPHIHIDSKSDFSRPVKKGRGDSRGRKNVHVQTERQSASSFKKSMKKN